MRNVNKFLVLYTTFLLLTSLLVLSVIPVTAQGASKPSVPQFSVKFFDNSYDVPSSTTSSIDQYTGKEIINTTPGRHVDNRSIEVTIKNQPFTPYTDNDGNKIDFYYRVEFKGHFGEDWQAFGSGYIAQSNSGYTVVRRNVDYDVGVQLDFRVIAVIGVLGDAIRDTGSLAYFLYGITSPYIESEVSRNTSGIQTFTIPSDAPSSPPSHTATLPTNPFTTPNNNQPLQNQTLQEPLQLPRFLFHPLVLLVVVVLFAGVVVSVVMVFLRRYLKTSYTNDSPNQTWE